MANLTFKKGTYSALQTKIAAGNTFAEGALYFTTDEGGLYLGNGTKNLTRIQGSVLYFNSLDEFTKKTKPPYSTDVLYFIADSNALVRWTGSEWIQLNQTDATFKALEGTVTDLSDKLTTLTAHVTTAESDIDALEAGLAAETARAEAAEGTLQSNIEAEAVARATAVTAEETARKEAISSLTTTVNSINDTVASHTTSIAANEEAIADETAARTSAISTLTIEVGKKVNTSDYNTKMTALDKSISDLESDVAGLADDVASNAANISANKAAIESEVGERKTAITGLQTQVTQNASDIATLTGTVNANKTAADAAAKAASDAAAAAQTTADAAKTQAETNAANLADEITRAKKAEEDNADAISAETAAREAAISRLREELTGDSSSLGDQLEALTTRVTTAEEDIDNLESNKVDKSTYSTDKSGLESKISANTTLINTNKSAIEANASNIATNTSNISKNADEISTIKNKIGDESTSTSILGKIAANAKAISDEAARAAAAEEANAKAIAAEATARETAINTAVSTLNGTIDSVKSDLSSNYLKRSGGTMTGAINMGSKKITNLATPTDGTDAVTKAYVDNAMKTADAMTFKGVVTLSAGLPTGAVNKGDTYKVGEAGTYAGIDAKVGDLIIYNGDDTTTAVAASWVHVTSGYEDDYLQSLKYDASAGLFYLTDGVHEDSYNQTYAKGSFKIQSNSENLSISVSTDGVITADLVWGTF